MNSSDEKSAATGLVGSEDGSGEGRRGGGGWKMMVVVGFGVKVHVSCILSRTGTRVDPINFTLAYLYGR